MKAWELSHNTCGSCHSESIMCKDIRSLETAMDKALDNVDKLDKNI